MKRYSFFILSILLGLLSATAAVQGELRGTVSDAETGEPIPGVVVQALNSTGRPVAFASSSASGGFRLKFSAKVDSISFRCIGYEARKLPANYNFSEPVMLSPATTQLNDVIVRAPDIYAKGDTLVFNVSRYAKAEDNAILDVIKRLPGITVEKDGTIKYQGKPINKFYIDGNDFVGGQYGLVTENISHEDVKSVEVMENHQPVKALEGIEFPEEAGINLKLKDDARSSWVGVAKGTTGAEPFLYDGSLYAMRIASKMQNIITLRGGNTAWNPATQISEHDFNDMFSSDYAESLWPEYISADIISTPLSEKRTRDNLSWIANTIAAWKHGDNSMRLKLNYVGDRLDYNSAVNTNYFSQTIPNFIQKNSLRTQTHDLSAQFNSEINKRGYFLKDKLTFDAVWDNAGSSITGTMHLDQKVRRRTLSAVNDLKLVKRNDKKIFELVSRNSFFHSPDRLSVLGENAVVQRLGITDFRSTTESQYGKLTRFWKFYISGGLDVNYHRMDANLSGMGVYDNSGIHNAFLSNIYATPQVDFDRNNWRLSAKIATKWLHHSLCGQHDYINLTPRLYVRKKISARSEFSGSIFYRLKSPQAYLSLRVPVLADYRNLFIGRNEGKYSQDVSAGLSYRYRNPLNAFFFNVSASYNYSRSTLMSDQLFIDDIIISTFADRISNANTWYLNGGLSKGLGHTKMVVGFDINTSTSSASSMRDNVVAPYSQLSAGIKPYFRGSLMRWLSLTYEANYGFSRLKVESIANSYHSFSQNLYATVIPCDRLQFTLGADHFLTRFPEGNTENLILIDASAVYHLNNKIRLSLTADNLLNKRRYDYVSYGTLSRTEHSFQIRPRNILASIQYRF
ncbi:MAG: TonB-dependent receptor [Staphylococcus sp.]|nr:TonB-dependent receptor [Staphylococcus sp.]